MKELLRTNDPVLLTWLAALLRDQGVESVVFDTHTSVLEGSANAIPRRMMVIDDDYVAARRILIEAGEGTALD
jgi:hypothetical protein